MDEMFSPFNEHELSTEDLEVLQAFDAKEDWLTDANAAALVDQEPLTLASSSQVTVPNWLDIFITEVAEDIVRLQLTLGHLEAEEHIDPARFVTLQHIAHKIRGAAGTVECHGMAMAAHYIEATAEQIALGMIFPVLGLHALIQAVTVLELALQHLLAMQSEGNLPLEALAETFQALVSELPSAEPMASSVLPEARDEFVSPAADNTDEPVRVSTRVLQNFSMPLILVDTRKVEKLIYYSEQLAELRAPLEGAQEQYDVALHELSTAQARIRLMQPQLSSLLFDQPVPMAGEFSSSSLVARILQRSIQHNRNGHRPRSDNRKSSDPLLRDELNMERYTAKDMLIRSLTEAISDVTVAATHVETTSRVLLTRQQEYIAQVTALRSSALLLRLAPLKTLISRLQHTISTSKQHIRFDVIGEETEVDQVILDSLIVPLSQMVRVCIANIFSVQENAEAPFRIWLHAYGAGNEISLEIGFSMTVNGGAIEVIREPIQLLNGSYSLQRNETGGISFFLRFPRSHGMTQCLIVQAGSQRLLVPFSQVWRVEEDQQLDPLYHLCDLLDFPHQPTRQLHIRPVLALLQASSSRHQVSIAVDAVEGEAELSVKPLAPYLQRPGISGAAVDGHGNALLVLDLPELLRQYIQRHEAWHARPTSTAPLTQPADQHVARILIADDSVSLRRSLGETLRHAHYAVTETRDGIEALENVLEDPPDLCLLDIEMPNLNGFDLLNLMHQHSELANVKVIVLTSRSSEWHVRHARDLGAHAYLIKPCSRETLLETVQELLHT